MKKLISLLLALAIVLFCAAAFADLTTATPTDPSASRGIKIKPAGTNPWPTDGTSPTTGRLLSEVEAELFEDGFGGMAVTGNYYPVMVQHCGFAGAVGIAAPFYGTCADVYYELAKSQAGHSRMCMIFNDILPKYAGGSRSTRVGYIWIRQEWNAPYFFQGRQQTNYGPTDVDKAIDDLKLPYSGAKESDVPWSDKVIFDGFAGTKQWLRFRYRVNDGSRVSDYLPKECNVAWAIADAVSELLGERSFEDFNHTWKFGALPEGGESAETVYVLFKDDGAKQEDTRAGMYFYYNSMYQYDPDENVYYRYMIDSMENPEEGAILFREQRFADEVVTVAGGSGDPIESGYYLEATLVPGEAITFANVIIQYIDMNWDYGGECPLPTLKGSGNADIFMGGKRFECVWNRETYNDRTVFYGPDGEEITLQPGRTIIVLMDYKTAHRGVRYE